MWQGRHTLRVSMSLLPWQQSGKRHTEDKEWNKITQINELGKLTRHWLAYRYPVKWDRNGVRYLLEF